MKKSWACWYLGKKKRGGGEARVGSANRQADELAKDTENADKKKAKTTAVPKAESKRGEIGAHEQNRVISGQKAGTERSGLAGKSMLTQKYKHLARRESGERT